MDSAWDGQGYDLGTVRSNGQGGLRFELDMTGQWIEGQAAVYTFGAAGDQVILGDWNAWGRYRAGCRRPDDQGDLAWSLDTSGTGTFGGNDTVFTFGHASDIPLLGSWRP